MSRLERAEGSLTISERRVADVVRSNFEAATRMTITELAHHAEVSQPTVTRFCRSLGCASFSEFKINLAAVLTVAAAYLRTERSSDSDAGSVAHTVVLRAVNALQSCLDQLDSEILTSAIGKLTSARRIDIYGQGGGSASMIEDAKLRFFRLGIPVSAYCDGHQQRMSAATLGPGDAVLAISNSGKSKPVYEAVEIARSFGAETIALTRPGTPLADASGLVIPMVIAENDNGLLPTPSRYAHLAVIDTLAAGVAMNLGSKSRNTLRRVRYTLARIGIAIATPSTDPAPLTSGVDPEE